MIIQSGTIISNRDDRVRRYASGEYTVYYKGIIFISGKRCGDESIEALLLDLHKSGDVDFAKVYGNYFIHIVDHRHDRQLTFTDNSGIFKVYTYKDCVSTSFLELIDHFEINAGSLNCSGITEFLHFGFTYFDSTLIEGINRLNSNTLIVFENQKTIIKGKGLKPIDSAPEVQPEEYFSDLVHAVGGNKVSVDLTGGFDSRLILSFLLKTGVDFELAISGLPGNKDISIGEKIAAAINKAYYPTYHQIGESDLKELYAIFEQSDAQLDVIGYHRNNQLNQDRQSRNIDLQLSGIGGELYKDFWWLQDFPFYNKRTANLERLYKYRIEGTGFPHTILGQELMVQSRQLKSLTLNKLKSYVLDTNTKTYDNIYFNYKMNTHAGVAITTANNYFDAYAPLLENELVKTGFHLKRRTRFFNNFHRKLITRRAPEIARIRTTEGITSSSLHLDKLTDYAFYSFDKAKRLMKQVLRKLTGKTYLQETPTDNRIYSVWKASRFYEESVEVLKAHKILAEDCLTAMIPENLTGKIITLRLLIDRLNHRNQKISEIVKEI